MSSAVDDLQHDAVNPCSLEIRGKNKPDHLVAKDPCEECTKSVLHLEKRGVLCSLMIAFICAFPFISSPTGGHHSHTQLFISQSDWNTAPAEMQCKCAFWQGQPPSCSWTLLVTTFPISWLDQCPSLSHDSGGPDYPGTIGYHWHYSRSWLSPICSSCTFYSQT